jgi:hypothetical protein
MNMSGELIFLLILMCINAYLWGYRNGRDKVIKKCFTMIEEERNRRKL